MTRRERARLQSLLVEHFAWLASDELGPRTVEAGPCDACGHRPRLLTTCGPGAAGARCRDCALEAGDDGWCDGHQDEGRAARRWAASLPDDWANVVVLYWVSTGEIRIDSRWAATIERRRLPVAVREIVDAVSRS